MKRLYRASDGLPSPKEQLKKLTKGKYMEISGSRAISPFLDITNTRSICFKNLLSALRELVI
jgi:hypothetical protein